MATTTIKNSCVKCVKGTGIVTCDGCRQSFCNKHLSEHRQELLQEMNRINGQCEHFRQNLAQENDPGPILSAIDDWEKQSIGKINSAAEKARADVRQMTERTISDFNQALNKITKKIESSRETGDAIEIDLIRWTEQFQTLQDLLKLPFPISVISDEKPVSKIHFIKVKYEPPVTDALYAKEKSKQYSTIKVESHSSVSKQANSSAEERFYQVAGHVGLSEGDLVATCVGYSSICGIKHYGTGIHRIRFRIIAKKHEGIFFGILTSMQHMIARASELPSVHGWRDFDRVIINGNAQLKARKEKNIEPGDEMTLIMDCDRAEISLTHHQLKQKVQMPVDLKKCPLPWTLLVSSYGDDVISMLR
jgi:hypothetical protein